jgi:hypothetical protein
MGRQPHVNEWGLMLDSRGPDGTRPTNADGTSVTPGASNTYGSYAALGLTLTDDVYWIEVLISVVNVTATNRMVMVDIGADPAGGSAYASIIPDLLAGSPLSNINAGGMTIYRFPLRIKAGTTLAAKAASLNADTTAIKVYVRLKCQPTHPELVRVGSFVQVFGVSSPTVGGVALTPGAASDGAYVEVGTADKRLFFLEFGYSINDSTMTAAALDVDIAVGDASNKRVVIHNAQLVTGASELLVKPPCGEFAEVAIGDKLYARSQSSAAADSLNSVAIYGVGG